MYEHHTEPLLPRQLFISRMVVTGLQAAMVLSLWLLLGMAGYHWIAGLSAVDSLLNASMIMSGMGPVDRLETTDAKIFASIYAVVSGVVFLSTFAIVIAPIAHRLLHYFHRQPSPSEAAKNSPARLEPGEAWQQG